MCILYGVKIVKMKDLKKLILTRKTVFTTEEIQQIFSNLSSNTLKVTLYRAKLNGELLNPQRGVWTLPVYDMNELAGKLFPGGYISLEPVLFQAGVMFQYYGNTIQCIWHKNADIFFNNQNYTARVLKKDLYNNSTCIQEFDGYRKAMPERAFCDLVYLRPQAQVDNPQYFQSETSKVRFEMLLPFYPKTTQKRILNLISKEL